MAFSGIFRHIAKNLLCTVMQHLVGFCSAKSGEGENVLGIDDCLERVMAIPGARSVTLVDHTSGLAVAAAGEETLADQHEDAASTTDLVRTVLSSPALAGTRTGDEIEDIIVSGTHGFHLLALLNTAFDGQLFLHLRVDRERGNLALARHRLQSLLREMAGA